MSGVVRLVLVCPVMSVDPLLVFSSPGTLAPVASDVLGHPNSNGSSPWVSGAVVEKQLIVVEGWNSVKQLAAILGLYAATFFLTRPPRLPACLPRSPCPLPLVALPFMDLAPWVSARQLFSARSFECDRDWPVHGVRLDGHWVEE